MVLPWQGSVKNWRFDPFTETYNAVLKSNEDRIIPSSSPYQVRLYEVPREDSPSSVDIVILVELDEDLDNSEVAVDVLAAEYDRVLVGDVLLCDDEQMYVSAKPGSPTLTVTRGYGGTTPDTHSDGTQMEILNSMSEITSGSPATREFRVDYDYDTGLVLFNSAEAGYDIRCDYWGLGSPFHNEVMGLPNPLPLAPADFIIEDDQGDYEVSDIKLLNRTSTSTQNYYAPVYLPHGAKVIQLTTYGYKNGTVNISIKLKRYDRAGTAAEEMAEAALTADGYTSADDTTIDYATIDNISYGYVAHLILNPNATAVTNAVFTGGLIYWEWS